MRTVTDDKWHVPGESSKEQPIKFADLTFYKANLKKEGSAMGQFSDADSATGISQFHFVCATETN